jgi:beta-galactosidase
MLDACGFPKDDVYYLRSWWDNKPVLHILPHWNWKGKEGKDIDVWVYSNSEEVELFLNKKSLGKKTMKKNSHLEWKVRYSPGTLEAVGFKNGKKIITDVVKTTNEPSTINLTANRTSIKADREDVAVITVQVVDKNNLPVPTAGNEITFSIHGPAKIIGVGNGDQTSHEDDRSVEIVNLISITNFKEKKVEGLDNRPEVNADVDVSTWADAFKNDAIRDSAKAIVYRGNFELPENFKDGNISLLYMSIGKEQHLYVNGKELATSLKEERAAFKLDKSVLHAGKNNLTIVTVPFKKKNSWETLNTHAGTIQLTFSAPPWKRKLFNGLAQVIVQSTENKGEITLTATSPGLKEYNLKIQSVEAPRRVAVDE